MVVGIVNIRLYRVIFISYYYSRSSKEVLTFLGIKLSCGRKFPLYLPRIIVHLISCGC